MEVKIERVSKETIKPWRSCSSTGRMKLSLLDQFAPSFYVPVVLFYSISDIVNVNHAIAKLKTSLSQTLVKFHPLVGKIYDDAYVEVRLDDGVAFTEAHACVALKVILEKPDTGVVDKLLPLDCYGGNGDIRVGDGVPVLAVQSTVFDCGGVAVGVCISHKVADGATLSAFLDAWARISMDGDDSSIMQPRLSPAELFPPREMHLQTPTNFIQRGKIVARRLLFDAANLARLKAEVTGPCTRVEAVTALISKTATDSAPEKSSLMVTMQVVNLRPRMDPPLPENTLGNIWRGAIATVRDVGDAGLSGVVTALRREIRKVDGDYAARLGTEAGFSGACRELEEAGELMSRGDVPFYKFSSWVRFPLYEADFGWGKPTWACVTAVPIEGAVILLGDRNGDGIEAWVNLEERHAACFEENAQLLRFASVAPGSS